MSLMNIFFIGFFFFISSVFAFYCLFFYFSCHFMSCHVFYMNNVSYTLIICSNYLFFIPFQLLFYHFLPFLVIFPYCHVASCGDMSHHVKMGPKKKMQKVLGNSFSTHQIRPVCKISCFYPKSPPTFAYCPE